MPMPTKNAAAPKPVAHALVGKPPQSRTAGGERLMRLWGMLVYLGHHSHVSLETLAHEFGITKNQAEKDVKALSDVETPGQTGFYLVDLDYEALDEDKEVRLKIGAPVTIPMHFADDDVAPLIAGLQALKDSEFVGSIPDRVEVVDSALHKLKEIAGPQADALDLKLPQVPNPLVAQILAKSIMAGQRISIEYVTTDDVVTRRDVDPVVVVTQDRHAYLRGYCYFRKQPRVFRLDRILKVTPLEMPVDQKNVATVTRDSNIAKEAAMAGSFDATVVLGPGARWLAEELPAYVYDLPDGNFEVHLQVASRHWLEGLLLGVAPHVLSVTPPELALDVANMAQTALANY